MPKRANLPLLPALMLAFLSLLYFTPTAQAQTGTQPAPVSPPPVAPQTPPSQKLSLQSALILVDGQPMTSEELEKQVSPDHIESIDVLKSDEALAKYGPSGRNGAVLITTKK